MNPVNLSLSPMQTASALEAGVARGEAAWQLLPSEAVVQVAEPMVCVRLQAPPRLSPGAIAAMQQLVDLLKQLRSPAQGGAAPQPLTPEALAPYVSEEIEEVLQVLTEEDGAALAGAIAAIPAAPVEPPAAIAPIALRLETLLPLLLWNLARTGHPVMQLLEGVAVAVQTSDADQPSPGVLRLVASLQVATPEAQWAVDLVTRDRPPPGLDRRLSLWLDPATPLATYLDLEGLSEAAGSGALPWADRQLQYLTQAILGVSPALQPWLTGFAARCLIPGQPWYLGQLRLKLDWELSPQAGVGPGASTPIDTPVEAELMDELPYAGKAEAWPRQGDRGDLPQVAVFEVPPQPQIMTTMVRLSAQSTLDELLHRAVYHDIEQGLGRIFCEPAGGGVPLEERVLHAAYRLAALPSHAPSLNWALLQPELVLEELVPKLLWQVARSSYELMSWLGGVDAVVLHPGTGWATGTLRFVVILTIALGTAAPEEKWAIDLATGRFLPQGGWQLDPAAMVRCPGIGQLEKSLPDLVDGDTLTTYLEQTLQTQAPAIAPLMAETAIAWLTPEHDWQAGILWMKTGLEWLAHPAAGTL